MHLAFNMDSALGNIMHCAMVVSPHQSMIFLKSGKVQTNRFSTGWCRKWRLCARQRCKTSNLSHFCYPNWSIWPSNALYFSTFLWQIAHNRHFLHQLAYFHKVCLLKCPLQQILQRAFQIIVGCTQKACKLIQLPIIKSMFYVRYELFSYAHV